MSEEENWRSVVGFEGIYEVSDLGRVRRCDNSPKMRMIGDVLRISLCNRYQRVTLFRDGKRSYHSVHDLVAAAFIGPKPAGHHVDHIDGNCWNNRPSNHEYVLPKENVNRAIERNLKLNGKRRSDGKLNKEDVVTIRSLSEQGLSNAELGRRYGVAAPHISQIVSRKKWGSVE